jgi:hypothetical protein
MGSTSKLLMRSAAVGWLFLFASGAFADVSLVGNLSASNPNDVLFVSFTLPSAETVTIQSYGFGGSAKAPGGTNAAGAVIAPGGFDTYFSLFSGVGPGATFLASNDDGLCPPGDDTLACRDSTLSQHLAAGAYTLAVSVFDNFSFAENLGAGTLGDGFIGLGSYFNLDQFAETTSAYAVDLLAADLTVTGVGTLGNGGTTTVPEPVGATLLGTALVALGSIRKFRRLGAGGKELE